MCARGEGKQAKTVEPRIPTQHYEEARGKNERALLFRHRESQGPGSVNERRLTSTKMEKLAQPKKRGKADLTATRGGRKKGQLPHAHKRHAPASIMRKRFGSFVETEQENRFKG